MMNDVDQCKNTIAGVSVNAQGCADYQVDTDGDGVYDDKDDFPTDAEKDTDTDKDGVDDSLDAYPNDPLLSSVEETSNTLTFVSIASVLAIAGVVLYFVFGRNEEGDGIESAFDASSDAMFSGESLEEMSMVAGAIAADKEMLSDADFGSVAQHSPQQWQDENGVHWTKNPDGSMMWYDGNSSEWITYQIDSP